MITIDYTALRNLISQGYNLFDVRSTEAFESGFIQYALYFYPADYVTIKALETLAYFPIEKSVVITEVDELSKDVFSILKKALGNDFNLLVNFNLSEAAKQGLETDIVIGLYAEEFALDLKHDKQIAVFDLRPENDFSRAHIKDSENITFNNLATILLEFDKDDKIYLIGDPASTALTAASLLRGNGFNFCRPLLEEFSSLQNIGLPINGKGTKRSRSPK